MSIAAIRSRMDAVEEGCSVGLLREEVEILLGIAQAATSVLRIADDLLSPKSVSPDSIDLFVHALAALELALAALEAVP